MPITPSAAYSLTIRLSLPARPTTVTDLSKAIIDLGGMVSGMDVSASGLDRVKVDITCSASSSDHAQDICAALRAMDDVIIDRISDRTFLAHLGGKIRVEPKSPIRNRDDLSLVYTPGVARVCQAIAEKPADARNLTIKGNTVAVVTDGTAILGLGDLGPLAALPVMEGKAALFKRFADIDAFPICLDTTDEDEIVATVRAIAPSFAGINLEDISAPRCFSIEERLQRELDIPVFHDDQHGTAIVVLSALLNALKVVNKDISSVKIAMSGAGAAGTAILKLLIAAGAEDVIVSDVHGILYEGRDNLDENHDWTIQHTNKSGRTGTLRDSLVGAEVFIGVSAGNILTGDDIATMGDDAVVMALANPTPEVDPIAAAKHAAVVATGRSDFANQINNVLVFPGVFRGLLDSGSENVTIPVMLAAARALSNVVADDERNAAYIIPSVFHKDVTKVVARAVRDAAYADAENTGARDPKKDDSSYSAESSDNMFMP